MRKNIKIDVRLKGKSQELAIPLPMLEKDLKNKMTWFKGTYTIEIEKHNCDIPLDDNSDIFKFNKKLLKLDKLAHYEEIESLISYFVDNLHCNYSIDDLIKAFEDNKYDIFFSVNDIFDKDDDIESRVELMLDDYGYEKLHYGNGYIKVND